MKRFVAHVEHANGLQGTLSVEATSHKQAYAKAKQQLQPGDTLRGVEEA